MEISTLHTDRLTLAPIASGDLDTYAAIYGDPEVMAHIGPPMDRTATWKLMARLAGFWVLGGLGTWTVKIAETDEPIGAIGFQLSETEPEPEIGWIFRSSSWGNGYATEAARAALSQAYANEAVSAVLARISATNVASIAIAKKLGMSKVLERSTDEQLAYLALRQKKPRR
jgi:RimJ/RimL family protein N-acetyltransferase